MENQLSVTYQAKNFPELKNDLVLCAAKGKPVKRIPVWIMRQAGRYLPEFRDFRVMHDFFKICDTPELAAEVTLLPIRRFDLDAAIIFSDILIVPRAMGLDIQMIPEKGPTFSKPLESIKQFDDLKMEDVLEKLTTVGKALTITRHKLEGKVPLIGFAGGPWTIMSYMIEGGGSKTYSKSKKWLYAQEKDSHKLLKLITDITIDYLVMQVKSGAQMLQVFESNCEYLTPDLFSRFLEQYLSYIPKAIEERLTSDQYNMVPLILFCKGGFFCLEQQAKMSYDVIGIDWQTDPTLARRIVGENKCLQGNLDPCAMYANRDDIKLFTETMISRFGGKNNLIGNLGHGLYPDTPIEGVEAFIEAVHSN